VHPKIDRKIRVSTSYTDFRDIFEKFLPVARSKQGRWTFSKVTSHITFVCQRTFEIFLQKVHLSTSCRSQTSILAETQGSFADAWTSFVESHGSFDGYIVLFCEYIGLFCGITWLMWLFIYILSSSWKVYLLTSWVADPQKSPMYLPKEPYDSTKEAYTSAKEPWGLPVDKLSCRRWSYACTKLADWFHGARHKSSCTHRLCKVWEYTHDTMR